MRWPNSPPPSRRRRRRHLETTAQGNAFVEATRAAWPCAALDRLKKVWDGPVAYPVAVGASRRRPRRRAGGGRSRAFLQAVAANWVSAGVRLIPLGQTDGQRVLAALEPMIAATAQRALATALDDIGAAAFRADLASARHETQYTRLFRLDNALPRIEFIFACVADRRRLERFRSAARVRGLRWSAGRRCALGHWARTPRKRSPLGNRGRAVGVQAGRSQGSPKGASQTPGAIASRVYPTCANNIPDLG